MTNKEYKNWYKALLRIQRYCKRIIQSFRRSQKIDWILLGILILMIPIWLGISEKLYSWLNIKNITDFLNGKELFNLSICFIISSFAIWWWYKIWKDEDIRPYRLGIILFLFSILVFDNNFTYVNIVGIINYKVFFLFLLKVSFYIMALKFFLIPVIISNFWKFIVEIAKKVKGYFKKFIENSNFYKEIKKVINTLIYKQDNKSELKGFSVDNTEIKLEDNLIKYAETLVKKLKNTDLSKESFAVGITGEWGSGKSTFLNTMKEKIEKAKFAEIVEFNPWLCNSPEQVTQDFFATLINKLSPKHSTLSRDINKYAKLLNKIAKASLSIFSIDLDLTPGDDSLDELKDKISKKLKKLPKKVVILIDDTDRLEGNEIFEILRLIRNTADFRNVIYIATYDKEYVTDVLKENKIKAPSSYLEKIFQVEVPLLKVTDHKLWEYFKKIISKQDISIENNFTKNISNIDSSKRELILNILNNYRRIKRFVEYYMFSQHYTSKNILRLEIKAFDLLWIELLQFYDQKTYNVLKNEPEKILVKSNGRYYLLNGISKNEISDKRGKFEDIPFWQPLTPNILEQIFGDNIKTLCQSICYIESYEKYFTLNLSKLKLSVEDFRNIFKQDNTAKQLIKTWTNDKSYESILHNFNHPYIMGIEQPNYKNFFCGLFELSLFAIENNKQFPIHFYKNSFYDALLRLGATNTIENAIKEKIEKINTLDKDNANTLILNLSKLLNNIYKTKYYDDNYVPMECYTMIINNNNIKNFLKELVTKYLNINTEHSAKDVFDNNSNLCKLLKNCCVTEEDRFKYGDGDTIFIQIVFDIIIGHFKNKKDKPTTDELYTTLYDNIPQPKYEFEDGYEEDAYESREQDEIYKLIRNIFGGQFDKKTFCPDTSNEYEKFKEQCFITKSKAK